MATNKTLPTSIPVETFIATIEHKRRRSDTLLALEMYQKITQRPAVMWGPSIIGFGEHHYRYKSGKQGKIAAAGFSPRKSNMAFYVGDTFEGAEELFSQLGKYKKSVACLYINKLEDVDMTVLREIIARDFAKSVRTSIE